MPLDTKPYVFGFVLEAVWWITFDKSHFAIKNNPSYNSINLLCSDQF